MKTKTESPKGQERKNQILLATIESVATYGLENTTHETVAQMADLARPHIVYYFKTKDSLLLETFSLVAQKAQKITKDFVERVHTPIEKIEAVAKGAFFWFRKHPDDAAFLIAFYQMCIHDPKVRKIHLKVRQVGSKRIEGFLKDLEGQSSSHKQKALIIQNLITGTILDHLTTGRELSPATEKTILSTIKMVATS